jgi:hypothetical protein
MSLNKQMSDISFKTYFGQNDAVRTTQLTGRMI